MEVGVVLVLLLVAVIGIAVAVVYKAKHDTQKVIQEIEAQVVANKATNVVKEATSIVEQPIDYEKIHREAQDVIQKARDHSIDFNEFFGTVDDRVRKTDKD